MHKIKLIPYVMDLFSLVYCWFSQNNYKIYEGDDENLRLNLNTRLVNDVTIDLNSNDISANISEF